MNPTVPATAPNDEHQRILTLLTEGLREQRVLHLEYYSQNRRELGTRDIEPLALQRLTSNWYVVAWCRKAHDVRSFRLDRIKSIEVLSETFIDRGIDLSDHIADTPSVIEDAPRTTTVRFAPEVARWIVESRSDAIQLADGSALLHLATAGDQWLIEEILKYRGMASVVTPSDVRERIAVRSRELRAQLVGVPVGV